MTFHIEIEENMIFIMKYDFTMNEFFKTLKPFNSSEFLLRKVSRQTNILLKKKNRIFHYIKREQRKKWGIMCVGERLKGK